MTSVEDYVRMAEEAKKDGSHVGVITNYRNALDDAGYSSDLAYILSAAVAHAANLKKARDREAIAQWGESALQKMKPDATLADAINREIGQLRIAAVKPAGEQNAASQ